MTVRQQQDTILRQPAAQNYTADQRHQPYHQSSAAYSDQQQQQWPGKHMEQNQELGEKKELGERKELREKKEVGKMEIGKGHRRDRCLCKTYGKRNRKSTKTQYPHKVCRDPCSLSAAKTPQQPSPKVVF